MLRNEINSKFKKDYNKYGTIKALIFMMKTLKRITF